MCMKKKRDTHGFTDTRGGNYVQWFFSRERKRAKQGRGKLNLLKPFQVLICYQKRPTICPRCVTTVVYTAKSNYSLENISDGMREYILA